MKLKSGPSRVHSFVRFVNKSVRVVELRWVDYEGEHTPFKVIHPTLFVDVNTFVGHPWTVCDAVTVDRMVFDGKQVFEPVPFQLGDDQLPLRNTVNISLPDPYVADVVKDGSPDDQKPIVARTANIWVGLPDLQQDFSLMSVHQSQSTVEFWKQYSTDKYPALRQTSQRPLSVFETTYCCESMYSAMMYIKSKNLAVLTNQHLKELQRAATTCYVPDFMKIETHKSTWK